MDIPLTLACNISQGENNYIITVRTQEQTLIIDLEQKFDINCWTNSFSLAYIQELTHQTGYRRKFRQFTKLLGEAISAASAKDSPSQRSQPPDSSLKIEILTYQDLENMKQKQSGTAPTNVSTSSNSNNTNNNKRYIILSTPNEQNSERVHYPLSLNMDDKPDPEKLKQRIRRLQQTLGEVKVKSEANMSRQSFHKTSSIDTTYNNPFEKKVPMTIDQLKSENEMLQSKLKRMEESKYRAVQFQQVIQQKEISESELERLKRLQQEEMQSLQKLMQERDRELENLKKDSFDLQKQLASACEGDQAAKRLRAHILKLAEETENQIAASRLTIERQQKEIQSMEMEKENIMANEKKQSLRIKQLEIQHDTAIKRSTVRGLSDRIYSPYSTKSSVRSKGSIRSASPGNQSSQLNNSQNSFESSSGSQISPSYSFKMKSNTNTSYTRNSPSSGVGANQPGNVRNFSPMNNKNSGNIFSAPNNNVQNLSLQSNLLKQTNQTEIEKRIDKLQSLLDQAQK